MTENMGVAPISVGDVLNLKGPSVPGELEDKYFRVVSQEDGQWVLSPPYVDAACTVRYHPKPPTLRAGRVVREEES